MGADFLLRIVVSALSFIFDQRISWTIESKSVYITKNDFERLDIWHKEFRKRSMKKHIYLLDLSTLLKLDKKQHVIMMGINN